MTKVTDYSQEWIDIAIQAEAEAHSAFFGSQGDAEAIENRKRVSIANLAHVRRYDAEHALLDYLLSYLPTDLPPANISELVERGALFVVNHSAGKDSQAMMIKLRKFVPVRQLLVIHADLGKVEWDGNIDHIKATAPGLPLVIAKNENKTFLEMVEKRGMWPSPGQRQCTSDLKRDPINREIRRYLKAHPEFNGLVVNCMGIRAAESPARSKQIPFRFDKRNSVAGREIYDWLPIFEMTTEEVFATIKAAGQEPHPAYKAGMSRLSCVFCIMANRSDLRTAAILKPNLYREYVELEKKIGHTMAMDGRSLEEVTGITIAA